MKKLKKTIIFLIVSSMLVGSATPVFASGTYENSIASKSGDYTSNTVEGYDKTQNVYSQYNDVVYEENGQISTCYVYSTIEEGSDVYNGETGEFEDGSIVVSLPSCIILEGDTSKTTFGQGTGLIKAKGNIAGTSYIKVVAEDTVTLSQEGKEDVLGDITQEYEGFALTTSTINDEKISNTLTTDFNDNCKSEIKVSAKNLTAGSWSGSYTNTITLESNE